jgi:hypothetical protein
MYSEDVRCDKWVDVEPKKIHIFQDMDGCLCAFDERVRELTDKYPKELEKKDIWKAVYSIPDFFENLDWQEGGKELWNAIKQYRPTILTGLPKCSNGEQQKRNWCSKHLGDDVPVIVCPSKDKHLYAKPGFILIDDRNDVIEAWKNSRGIGILHRTTARTLHELERYL